MILELLSGAGAVKMQSWFQIRVRAPLDVRGAISASLDAKIKLSGAVSNITLTSPSSWKEFNSSKVASDDGLSIEL